MLEVGVNLPGFTLGGNLSVTAGGNIIESGAVIVNGAGATATFVAGANNITLDTQPNDFSTGVITSGNDVKLNDINAIDLGAPSMSGNLIVSAGGNITESGERRSLGCGGIRTECAVDAKRRKGVHVMANFDNSSSVRQALEGVRRAFLTMRAFFARAERSADVIFAAAALPPSVLSEKYV